MIGGSARAVATLLLLLYNIGQSDLLKGVGRKLCIDSLLHARRRCNESTTAARAMAVAQAGILALLQVLSLARAQALAQAFCHTL